MPRASNAILLPDLNERADPASNTLCHSTPIEERNLTPQPASRIAPPAFHRLRHAAAALATLALIPSASLATAAPGELDLAFIRSQGVAASPSDAAAPIEPRRIPPIHDKRQETR